MVNMVRLLLIKMAQLFTKTLDSDCISFTQHINNILDPTNSFYREYDKEVAPDLVSQA